MMTFTKLCTVTVRKIFLFLGISFGIIYFFLYLINSTSAGVIDANEQFTFLAQSFLKGNLYLYEVPNGGLDAVLRDGRYYWPLGPFPALVQIPFVLLLSAFDVFPAQALPQVFLILETFVLVYLLAGRLSFKSLDAYYLALAFCLGTTYMNVYINSSSWYFSHVVTVFLLFSALYEYCGKHRYWLIGTIMAAVLATRVTAAFGVVFFLLEILTAREVDSKQKIKKTTALLCPLLVTGLLLILYNFVRFGTYFDQGYASSILNNNSLIKAREYGIFNIVHVPGNLFHLLINAPHPIFSDGISHVLKFPYITVDNWGIGMFWTSPYLCALFFYSYRNSSRLVNLIIASILIALPIIFYYGIGFIQIGYRYSLDFLPFLFLAFMIGYKQSRSALSLGMIAAILFSAAFNLYVFFTVY